MQYTILSILLLICAELTAQLNFLSKDEEINALENMEKAAKESNALIFTPPKGWHIADPKQLPNSVKVMIVGAGAHEYPPSMNLGTENYKGTLKQYLNRIKEINKARGAHWKDLGSIQTEAGEGSLSQVNTKTSWGEIKMMHLILKKDGVIYILTASALKDEFPKFYKEFFASMKSLRFGPKS